MTIDQRIERLEHVTALHIEQAKQDYEENRRLWREQQIDIRAIWKRMDEGYQETQAQFRETEAQFQETDRRMAERDRITDQRIANLDERIAHLVSAIGELIRRLDGDKS